MYKSFKVSLINLEYTRLSKGEVGVEKNQNLGIKKAVSCLFDSVEYEPCLMKLLVTNKNMVLKIGI